MCVVSMVHDHYWKRFPQPEQPVAPEIDWSKFVIQNTVDLTELARLIAEFKAAVEAAKMVDKLTMQPNCVDPEKAKLQDRVAELEQKLTAIKEAANAT